MRHTLIYENSLSLGFYGSSFIGRGGKHFCMLTNAPLHHGNPPLLICMYVCMCNPCPHKLSCVYMRRSENICNVHMVGSVPFSTNT